MKSFLNTLTISISIVFTQYFIGLALNSTVLILTWVALIFGVMVAGCGVVAVKRAYMKQQKP